VEQADEHRHLHEDGQAAAERVDTVLPLEPLHLLGLLLPVVPVLLADLRDLRLELLHPPHRPHLVDERLVQDRPQREDQEHHRQRPGDAVVRSEEETEDLVPDPEDERDRVVDEVQHGACSSRFFRAERERRGGTGSTPPGCHGAHRTSRRTVSHEPCSNPCTCIASIAYALQVG
jgi:hypothetical protein